MQALLLEEVGRREGRGGSGGGSGVGPTRPPSTLTATRRLVASPGVVVRSARQGGRWRSGWRRRERARRGGGHRIASALATLASLANPTRTRPLAA